MPELRHKNGIFYAILAPGDTQSPLQDGFIWDRNINLFATPDLHTAIKYLPHAAPDARAVLQPYADVIAASRARATSFRPPQFGEREPLPFQCAGVEWAINRRSSLIADEPGLGKTCQALLSAETLRAKKVVIVSPAKTLLNWANEIGLWCGDKSWRIIGHKSQRDPARFTIVSYDVIAKERYARELFQEKYDLLIADEAHYAKNMHAQRTKALLTQAGLAGRAAQHICLSGTPMNRPIDLYPQLKTLSPDTIKGYGSYNAYGLRFCAGHMDRWNQFNVTGASNLDELNFRLRTTYMCRRLKTEVQDQLPERWIQLVYIDEAGNPAQEKEKKKEFDVYTKNNLASLVMPSGDEPTDRNSLQGMLSAFRAEYGLKKLKPSIAYIHELLESAEKLVVFAHHQSVIQGLMDGLKKYQPVKIDGSMNSISAELAKKQFRENPECRIIIGSKSMYESHTLVSASDIVFVEYPWSATEANQAIDRCHRLGQKNTVVARFLTIKDTIDEYMLMSITLKDININKAIN